MVGMDLTSYPLSELCIRILISPDPPPLANNELSQGHHLIALTAAICSIIVYGYYFIFLKSFPDSDHFLIFQ